MKQVNKINNDISLIRPLLDFKKNQLIKISKLIFGKFYKDPSNKNKKYLRTRIRNLQKLLEKSGINYDQIFKSIKNLASSRDTLNLYFDNIYMKITKKKKKKILINLKDFYSYNDETKMRVFEKSIKDLTNAYYSPRSKKILNLIEVLKIKEKNNAKLTLGGTAVYKDKNLIILEKDKKN
jgi:tRNA(Ile)-lysidine synthase